MSEDKSIKLIKAVKELNIGMGTIVDFLATKGYKVEKQPMAKLDNDMYTTLLKEFAVDKIIKEEAKQISIGKIRKEEPGQAPEKPIENRRSRDFENEEILIKNTGHFTSAPADKPKPAEPVQPKTEDRSDALPGVKVIGKIDLNNLNAKPPVAEKPAPVVEASKAPEPVAEKPVPAPEPVVEAPKAPEPVAEKPVPAPEPVVETPKAPEPVAEKPAPAPVVEAPKAPEPVAEKPAPAPFVAETPVAPIVVVEAPAAPIEGESNDVIRASAERLSGPKIIGKIQLPVNAPKRNPIASSSNAAGNAADHKRKRKRKDQQGGGGQGQGQGGGNNAGQQQAPPSGTINPNRPDFRNRPAGPPGGGNRPDFRGGRNAPTGGPKEEPSEKDIQDQIKATLARLSGAGKSGKFAQRAKFRRQKRDDVAATAEELAMEQDAQSKVLKVTEFVTANELALMMDVSVTQIISTCMSLGMFVSINQRLDAETLSIVADEFGYQVEFVKPQDEEANLDQEDAPEDLISRAPIVTIMGHVDHGKTSLLDFIRKTNVIGGEAGGITQHIGAYEVTLPDDKGKITFLDTPGHEAFTAMRARGAQVTDIVIIVIAADDSVMPQTREAINHAQAAGAPIIFAFNKIDRPGANADKVREQLSAMNILVEEWGGKYQTQEISAKTGLNIDLLLEKVLLEAELLELKANPNKRAVGTVIEAALDKGRGIVTTILVQAGRLKSR
jgi:translation initiation factor IF-2